MTDSERRLLASLRDALIPLHRTLLDWERTAYERIHGRTAAADLLKATVTDPQFAWLRPVSGLIVRIDELLDPSIAQPSADVPAILSQARTLVAPDEAGTPYAQRYHEALQQAPDVVLAHGRVTAILRDAGPTGTLH